MATTSKEILVTGGAGFIGSHLCAKLLSLGHTVYCLDNLYTGTKNNLRFLEANPHFHFIEADVCDPSGLQVDEIYHLACPASPVHYQKDPLFTMRTNVLGTMNMLDLASKNSAKLLLASTSEVYGDPLVHPQTEDYFGNVNTIGPRSCYDEGKRAAETLCMDYHRAKGVSISIARIFNTYGPHMDPADGRVVSNLIVQALQNDPLTIHGDGSQTRSFAYVQDMVAGLTLLMESDQIGPINLGNPQEFTVNQLMSLITSMTNTSSEVRYLPFPQDDPKRRRPDITKAKELLGWQPTIQLEAGLKETIRYFASALTHSK